MKVYQDTKIYIVSPAGSITGGPESLHQLCNKLRKKGYNAQMYYTPANSKNTIPEPYKKYENPFVQKVEDSENNILIVPETKTGILYKYQKIRKVIWWLAVDFHLGKNVKKHNFKRKSGVYALKRATKIQAKYTFETQKNITHFYQSEYVNLFLKSKGVENKYPLAAFLNKGVFAQDFDIKLKSAKIAYNPKKGFDFTKKIMSVCEYEFVPIKGMTPQQVAETLRQCKVYIDFGHHPGRERLPKEAVLSKCCVITGKRGSAKNPIDIPVSEEYKFEDLEENIPQIVERIGVCMQNYEERFKDFESYLKRVLKEEELMEKSIDKIFERNN